MVQNKWNPFFFQIRPGKDEKAFSIIKFKTMTDARDEQGNLLPDNDRITTLGNLLENGLWMNYLSCLMLFWVI